MKTLEDLQKEKLVAEINKITQETELIKSSSKEHSSNVKTELEKRKIEYNQISSFIK